MLIALPLISFTFIILSLVARGSDWRQAFLGAAVCFGLLLTTATELLSLFSAITYFSLVAFWGPVAFIALLCLLPELTCLKIRNQTRPLWGDRSILRADRASLYFAKRSQLLPYYSQAAEYFSKPGSCDAIGLVSSNDNTYEYPLWELLGRCREEMPRIEHINVNNVSGSIPLKNFNPCAVLEIH